MVILEHHHFLCDNYKNGKIYNLGGDPMYQTKYFKKHTTEETISLLTNVFNASHDGLFVCDQNGYPLLYNEALLEITGLPADFFNSNVAGIFDALKVKAVPFISAAAALEKKETTTHMIDYPDGKKAIVTATPYFNEKKDISFIVSNLRDITEINLIQKELEKTQKINQVYQNALEKLQNELETQKQIVYESKQMKQVVSWANRFAENDLPILLLGESGVGKDVVANYIHESSNREGSFIKINCGAIPDYLLESELFGYEKGAFTGAGASKKGLIELAHKGTLFLDEIGDLPFPLQVKLLNVLQDYKIRRLGGTQTKDIDVRIITATNMDLESLVEQKKFRLDLYYRLNVLSINIPPLRDRKADIPALIYYFINHLERKYSQKKKVNAQVLQQFMEYSWPGNIRELKNIVERMYHLSEGTDITVEGLPKNMYRKQVKDYDSKQWKDEGFPNLKDAILSFEKDYIAHTLEHSATLQECAEKLGISLSTLVRKKRMIK